MDCSSEISRFKLRLKYQCFILLRTGNIPRQHIDAILFGIKIFAERWIQKIIDYFVHEFIQKANDLNVFFDGLLESVRFWLINKMALTLIFIEDRTVGQKLVINSSLIIEWDTFWQEFTVLNGCKDSCLCRTTRFTWLYLAYDRVIIFFTQWKVLWEAILFYIQFLIQELPKLLRFDWITFRDRFTFEIIQNIKFPLKSLLKLCLIKKWNTLCLWH